MFSNRMVLFYLDLARSEPHGLPLGVAVETKSAASEVAHTDFEQIASISDSKTANQMLEERFSAGAILWLVRCEHRLAGYGWTLRGRTMQPHYYALGKNDVHLFDFLIFPQFRGRKLNPALVMYIVSELRARSYERAFIEAAEWNRSQLTSLSRTEFHQLGLARKVSVAGTTVVIWSNQLTAE
jgi:GNAT superfamily N-acetyltransferase